jgi:hypothetical protein
MEKAFGPHLSLELKPLKETIAMMDFPQALVHCADLLRAHCELP